MNLPELSVRRPVTILMIVLIMIVIGIVSLNSLPLDLMPDMELPIAVVTTSYAGAGPQEIENLITKPLERVISTVHGLDSLRSTSREGASTITVMFTYGTDMNTAAVDLREGIAQISRILPADASEPMVFKYDISSMAIIMLAVRADGVDLAELQTLCEDLIQPRFERLNGVASASAEGGVTDELQIRLSAEKMQGYGISQSYLAGIIQAENLTLPGGVVKKGSTELTVKTSGEFKTINEIQNMLIPLPGGGTVRLRDLADIELTQKESTSAVIVDGQPCLILSIQKQSDTNTVVVANAVLQEMNKIVKERDDIKIEVVLNTADYIEQSLSQVARNALAGCLLAVVVLYLFLRNIRTTLIIGITIPTSVIATFAAMYFMKTSLNMMTLGGLALGVGMLVDNAVVVLENIYRFRQEGSSRNEAAVQAAREVSMPLMASTLTTLAVFLPIVFTEGLASILFRPLAYTICISLSVSLVMALTLVPMLSSKFMHLETEMNRRRRRFSFVHDAFDRFFDALHSGYRSVLQWTISRRKTVVALSTACLVLFSASVLVVGAEFIPNSDQGFIQMSVSLPQGSKLPKTMAILDQVGDKIKDIPEIEESYLMGSGRSGTVYVMLKPLGQRQRSADQVSDELRALTRDIPGARISVSALSMMGMGVGGGSGAPISISLRGDDLETLRVLSLDVVDLVREVPGTQEVRSSYTDGNAEVKVTVNREAASQYGLTAAQIAGAVRSTISGSKATTFRYRGSEIDVVLKGDEQYSQNMLALEQIPIPAAGGLTVPLGAVATVETVLGPVSITRINQVRQLTVTSALAADHNVGKVGQEIQARLNAYQFPTGYSFVMGGQQEQMNDAFGSLYKALALGVLLVYMVMAAQFESLLYPFIIILAMPLGLAAGVFGLFVTGTPLSIVSIIGLIILAGVLVNNSIVLVDYINVRRRVYNESRDEAILRAGPIRLRPILMTTLTTVLAMIPLAMGIGAGAEMEAPLAIVVIFGLTLSTLVTLLVVPTYYVILDNVSVRWGHIFKKKQGSPSAIEEPASPV